MIIAAIVCAFSFAISSQQSLESLISKVDDERAITVSVMVEKLNGEVLFEHAAERSMVLASNTKIFTTAAALIELGEDYHWSTKVYTDGNDVAIVGGGDPSIGKFNDKDLAQLFVTELLQSLRSAGVVNIEHLYIDGSLFSEQRHILWPIEHFENYFCAPPVALSVNSSCLDVSYNGHGPVFYPSIKSSIAVEVYDKPADYLSAWFTDNGAKIWVRLPSEADSTVARYAVPDGIQFFGWWMQDELRAAGIAVEQLVLQEKPQWAEQNLLLDYSSAYSLGEMILEINKESNNFVAEMVLKTLGVHRSQAGSYKNGVAAVKAILGEHIDGIDGLSQLDGSGMARSSRENNSASPALVCELLREMCFLPQGEAWFDSLPIGGVDGTIGARFKDAVFQPQRIHAKTGFIYSKQSEDGRGASSLSGYLLLPDNEIAVFSFVVNFYRKVNANSNNRRFKSLQQQFLKQLIQEYSNE
jgi:D-alanyl-D-alanine carboxypeptidase/D-alanyl-D-alanine-endopeptidase (penicillin-binding protein 4)